MCAANGSGYQPVPGSGRVLRSHQEDCCAGRPAIATDDEREPSPAVSRRLLSHESGSLGSDAAPGMAAALSRSGAHALMRCVIGAQPGEHVTARSQDGRPLALGSQLSLEVHAECVPWRATPPGTMSIMSRYLAGFLWGDSGTLHRVTASTRPSRHLGERRPPHLRSDPLNLQERT